jgi:hypothetical protein
MEKGYVLFSGICTTNNFLHSLGLLICAGTNGYCCKGNVWSAVRGSEKDAVHKVRGEGSEMRYRAQVGHKLRRSKSATKNDKAGATFSYFTKGVAGDTQRSLKSSSKKDS